MSLAEVKYVRQLLEEVLDKLGVQSDFVGFDTLSKKLNLYKITKGKLISPKYLRENLWYEIRKSEASGITHRKFKADYLDRIAKILGKDDFRHFVRSCRDPLPEGMERLMGNWWSLVRANSGDWILKAPIRIYTNAEDGKPMMDMRGGQQLFTGPLALREGILFCELHSGKTKSFYLVMKVGVNEKVQVLQGIFAGISSAGDPIGGREVFIKEENLQDFEAMNWQKLALTDKSLQPEVKTYFGQYEGNCLKIKNASRFSLDDLALG
jgi:hypothetical protein